MLSKATTLTELLSDWAAEDPSLELYRFLGDGETDCEPLTIAALHRSALSIGLHLRELCKPGDRVLLVAPPGLDFIRGFFAIQHAGLIATTTYPPHPRRIDRTLHRLESIVTSCQPKVARGNPRVDFGGRKTRDTRHRYEFHSDGVEPEPTLSFDFTRRAGFSAIYLTAIRGLSCRSSQPIACAATTRTLAFRHNSLPCNHQWRSRLCLRSLCRFNLRSGQSRLGPELMASCVLRCRNGSTGNMASLHRNIRGILISKTSVLSMLRTG